MNKFKLIYAFALCAFTFAVSENLSAAHAGAGLRQALEPRLEANAIFRGLEHAIKNDRPGDVQAFLQIAARQEETVLDDIFQRKNGEKQTLLCFATLEAIKKMRVRKEYQRIDLARFNSSLTIVNHLIAYGANQPQRQFDFRPHVNGHGQTAHDIAQEVYRKLEDDHQRLPQAQRLEQALSMDAETNNPGVIFANITASKKLKPANIVIPKIPEESTIEPIALPARALPEIPGAAASPTYVELTDLELVEIDIYTTPQQLSPLDTLKGFAQRLTTLEEVITFYDIVGDESINPDQSPIEQKLRTQFNAVVFYDLYSQLAGDNLRRWDQFISTLMSQLGGRMISPTVGLPMPRSASALTLSPTSPQEHTSSGASSRSGSAHPPSRSTSRGRPASAHSIFELVKLFETGAAKPAKDDDDADNESPEDDDDQDNPTL